MPPLGALRALVSEDEVLVAQLIEFILGDEGLDPTIVFSGREAIKAVQADPGYQILITDIRVGDPPNGWEVAKAARRANPDIGVVYVTGDSMADWSAKGVPGSIVVAKPFSPSEIVSAVKSVLDRA